MILDATSEGFAPYLGYETWYRITGDLSSPLTPLVVAHGGPGATSDYVWSIATIARTGRPVIHYDQLGSGRSTHLRSKGAEFWTVELFLDELEFLLDHLGIADNYYFLGQSWGGMLGAEHGIRHDGLHERGVRLALRLLRLLRGGLLSLLLGGHRRVSSNRNV